MIQGEIVTDWTPYFGCIGLFRREGGFELYQNATMQQMERGNTIFTIVGDAGDMIRITRDGMQIALVPKNRVIII